MQFQQLKSKKSYPIKRLLIISPLSKKAVMQPILEMQQTDKERKDKNGMSSILIGFLVSWL
jgi:hypothetical protein